MPERPYSSRCFNPRLREGGDSYVWLVFVRIHCFNPRLREGGDVIPGWGVATPVQFQSTPPRGRRHAGGGLSA